PRARRCLLPERLPHADERLGDLAGAVDVLHAVARRRGEALGLLTFEVGTEPLDVIRIDPEAATLHPREAELQPVLEARERAQTLALDSRGQLREEPDYVERLR